MYDIRHCSCCYWLPRYKSESALKYRFGWKNSDMIHYYTEFLNMKDTIAKEDLTIDVNVSELQQTLSDERKERNILQDKMDAMQKQMEIMQKQFIETVSQMANIDPINEREKVKQVIQAIRHQDKKV